MMSALALPPSVRQASSPAPGRLERVPASVEAAAVGLGELRATPATFLGQEVKFQLQFRALVEDWNPYLSRFEPARWLALEAWPDEEFTWDEGVFDHPFARLFLRRGGGFEPLAHRARLYQRFEVRARVKEVFLGEPWIELIELVPLDGEVGEGTILHVTRARELAAEGKFDLALDQYGRAKAAPLPPHALAAVLAEMRAAEAGRDLARREGKKGGDPAKGKDEEKEADEREDLQATDRSDAAPKPRP